MLIIQMFEMLFILILILILNLYSSASILFLYYYSELISSSSIAVKFSGIPFPHGSAASTE